MCKTHPTMSNASKRWLFGKKEKPIKKVELPFSMRVTRTIRRSYEFIPTFGITRFHYEYPLVQIEA